MAQAHAAGSRLTLLRFTNLSSVCVKSMVQCNKNGNVTTFCDIEEWLNHAGLSTLNDTLLQTML
ncbi:hypothetical protein EBZ39_19760, partial [bacterium]|nr:hypothetical protein [bacterium]